MLVVTTPTVEGAPAVIGVKVDYFTAGTNNGMLAAIATGTAVIL